MPVTADTLAKYLMPSSVFVETGSAGGAGIAAALTAGFTEIYSADISEECVLKCRRRFHADSRVEVHHINTLEFLRELVPALPNPCVFWLDAHPDHDSPVLEELHILAEKASCKCHTILIDDRRLMHGHWRSVNEAQVLAALKRINPNYRIHYAYGYEKDDIIVATVTEQERPTDTLNIWFWHTEQNLGDTANLDLAYAISQRRPLLSKAAPCYLLMGSLLHWVRHPTYVWGTGVIRPDAKLPVKPSKIYAVRGPRTRKWLQDQGVNCPAIYGDPGILFPKLYSRTKVPQHEIGIIPHYADLKRARVLFSKFKIPIIDVRKPPNQVIRQLTNCKHILASNLHGIVAADAYEIPCSWIRLGNSLVGGAFKFLDYFEGCNHKGRDYVDLRRTKSVDLDQLQKNCNTVWPSSHLIDGLLDVCPIIP